MCSKKNVEVKVRKDDFKKVKKALMDFAKIDLLVGVPQEKTERKEDDKESAEPITNAELMFIHTNGSPARNIPPRPVIEPTIDENQERITKDYENAIKNVLDGKKSGMIELEKLGIWLMNKIKAKFGSEELAPLKPATIKAKGSDRPLIDTGQLRNSVTYVIRNEQ